MAAVDALGGGQVFSFPRARVLDDEEMGTVIEWSLDELGSLSDSTAQLPQLQVLFRYVNGGMYRVLRGSCQLLLKKIPSLH